MSKRIRPAKMDELISHGNLIRVELDGDHLQYQCGLCASGRAFEKLSGLCSHMLVHGISVDTIGLSRYPPGHH